MLMIAGLIAAIGIPSFNAILKGTALRNAATAMTDTLALARQLAIANRYMYRVEFITDATDLTGRRDEVKVDSYRIYFEQRKPPNDRITVGKWKLLPRTVVFDQSKRPPEGIAFSATGGAHEVPSGSQWPRSFLIVQEGKGEVKKMTIKVDGFTGRAKSDFGDTTNKP